MYCLSAVYQTQPPLLSHRFHKARRTIPAPLRQVQLQFAESLRSYWARWPGRQKAT